MATAIADYTAQEFEEKITKRTRSSWMAPVESCLFGIFLAAAIAGVLVNDQPEPRQFRAFFIFLVVLAPLFSCVWYWFFTLRPESLAKKMKDEQENPLSSEPIHPKIRFRALADALRQLGLQSPYGKGKIIARTL